MRRRLCALALAGSVVTAGLALSTSTAAANPQTTTNAPITCQTRFGAQAGQFTTTWNDDPDPVAAGEALAYRVTTPFRQELPSGLTGTYRGGQVFYRIPVGLTVTAVRTQPPPGGSPLSASAARQGDSIVVTSSGSVPIDGSTHATPDLLIDATTAAGAGGTQIRWLMPYRIVANVDVNGIGPVDADCTPNNPNTVVATTNVQIPGNRSPVVQAVSVPVTKDTTKVVTLAASDPDGDPVTFTADAPVHGTVTIVNGNRARYTPSAGYLGRDGFDVIATDGRGGSATARVSLDVIATAEGDTYPPVVNLTVPAHGAVYTPGQTVRAAFTCADGESGIESCSGTVANGAVIATAAGRHQFVVTARDIGGNTSQALVTYNVVDRAPANQPYTAISGQPNVLPITCNQLIVPFQQRIPATVAAPAGVPEGDTFLFRFAPGAMSVPPSTVATNATYVIAPPVRGTIVDARAVPGTGSANAANSIASIVNGRAHLTVPAVDGGLTGTTFTPRQLEVTIRANAAAGQQITTQFERYLVRLTTGQAGIDILTTDYNCPGGASGAPNPTLTRTVALDVTPPAIALSAPVHGGRYFAGQSVIAQYSCSDARGIASCTGTRPNGQAVDTSAGRRQFTVTASDNAGNVSRVLRTYRSFTPVVVNAGFTAGETAWLDAASARFGTPRNQLPGFGVAFIAELVYQGHQPAPVTGPSDVERPVVIATRYLPNDAARVAYQASLFGLNSAEYHWYGAMVAIYLAINLPA
jgi:hypothetical protein